MYTELTQDMPPAKEPRSTDGSTCKKLPASALLLSTVDVPGVVGAMAPTDLPTPDAEAALAAADTAVRGDDECCAQCDLAVPEGEASEAHAEKGAVGADWPGGEARPSCSASLPERPAAARAVAKAVAQRAVT